jgi:hypothetical protein
MILARFAARPARVALITLLVMLLGAGAWSVFWMRTAATAERAIENWRREEERRGNVYRCSPLDIGGYPFRIEVRCGSAEAQLAAARPAAVIASAALTVVAQIYDPHLLIAELTGPLNLAPPGGPATLSADWDLAQTSVRIDATRLQRLSVVLDGLRVFRPMSAAQDPVAHVDRMEWHVRPSPGDSAGPGNLDLFVRLVGASAPGVADWARTPFEAEIAATLHDIGSLRPKSVPALLREIQAAGGRVEITKARLSQGETLAVASGVLGLTPQGRLDGTMELTVSGLERLMTAPGGLGKLADLLAANKLASRDRLDQLKPALGALDRLLPSLGIDRNVAQAGAAASLALIGRPTELEGRHAVTLTLHFADGAASLGPMALGEVAPFF